MGQIDQFTNSKSVSVCFKEAKNFSSEGLLRGLIVPHAGYIYSGSIAASGYKLLKPKNYKKVIILGFYHGSPEEHSVKVQIPLIRYILGKNIPIEEKYINSPISFNPDQTTLVVASSDLSHYHPLDEANLIDHQSIEAILSQNIKKIYRKVDACGLFPILSLTELSLKFNWIPQLIDYNTSAAVTSDTSHVVGYGCIGYFQKND